ncbi:MAG: ribonuclease H-like domain-containing protein [Lachnospiraceae bacterium]|nr:ribonuclease H-like domain-containing protein [Lachnospiraceae bacterium]
MQHVHKEELYFKRNKLSDELVDEKTIFFDIETTGFSPKHSHVYLIGCARKIGEKLHIDQFFAENPGEEGRVIQAFLEILKDYTTIISFNGVGFDIPFLKAKCDLLGIPETLKDLHYLDIFKSVSEIKFLLKLPNYKQKTIEEFLGLERDDKYSGGELINVYLEYTQNPDEEKEQLLLLHNYEDIIGMTDLLPILTYLEIFHDQYAIKEIQVGTYRSIDGTNQQELLITIQNDYPVPKRVSYQYREFYLIMKDEVTTLRVPVYSGELHFFHSDYKDYYYLPQEDMAIHKSVAGYVDKGYREKAKISNCYTRKTGDFLPQYSTIMQPEFRKEYKDKVSYFEITEDFYSSDIMLRRYVDHILKLMLNAKK